MSGIDGKIKLNSMFCLPHLKCDATKRRVSIGLRGCEIDQKLIVLERNYAKRRPNLLDPVLFSRPELDVLGFSPVQAISGKRVRDLHAVRGSFKDGVVDGDVEI